MRAARLIGVSTTFAARQEDLDQTQQEVVRMIARLRQVATRAEAASDLAEAEVALRSLSRIPAGKAMPRCKGRLWLASPTLLVDGVSVK